MQAYGRQLAWLQQSVDPKSDTSPSRAARRKDRGEPLGLPGVEALHLLGELEEMGWCESGGFGPAPLSAQELRAWAWGTGQRWDEWEFRALRQASAAYCAQLARKDAPEPAQQAMDEEVKKKKPSLIGALASTLNGKPKDAT